MWFGNSLRSVGAHLRSHVGLRWPLQPWQSVIALAVLAGAALIALTVSQMQRQQARELAAIGARSQNVTRLLEGHAQEILHRLDLLMAHAVGQIANTSLPLSTDRPALRHILRTLVPVDGLIRSYAVIGPDGAVLATSAPAKGLDPASWVDGDHVAVHRGQADRGLFLGATEADGQTGLPIIPVSLRLNDQGGRFAGVLVALVDPRYFQHFYDSIDKGAGGFVTLFGRDGSILARSPFNAGLMLRNWRDSPLFRQHLPAASENTVRQVVVADGVDRIYSYRALQDYPVVASVGLSVDEALGPWRAAVWRDGALTGLGLAVLAVITGLLARQLRTGEQMSRRLADSEARWKFAIEGPGDALLDWDVPSGSVYFSSRWKDLLGYADEELGTHIDDWFRRIHPADRDRVWAAVRDHHAGRTASYACELRVACKDGSWKWILDRGVVVLRDALGQPVRMIGMQSDITEVKQAQAEVVASKRHLQQLSRHLLQAQEETRRRFASELHDRTSPNLAALRINLNFIASATPERRVSHGFVDRVLDTQALIEDTTASIREICADLHPAVLDGAGLLGAVRSYAYQFGQRTGVLVTVECPHAERRLAPELELALFRIVQEAMTNSAKHAMARRLRVQLELDANPIKVVITDDGVGMPAEQTDLPARGAGLGMRTMRDSVEFVGGRFSVQTAPGQGTQVCVEIDRAQEDLDA